MTDYQLLSFFHSMPHTMRAYILRKWASSHPTRTLQEVLLHHASEEAEIAAAEYGADRELGFDSDAWLEQWAERYSPAVCPRPLEQNKS